MGGLAEVSAPDEARARSVRVHNGLYVSLSNLDLSVSKVDCSDLSEWAVASQLSG
jgi:hypothetical protein